MSTVMSALQLEALAAVCDAESFDEAAHRLKVTPSALSQRIASLERELGQVLVRRRRPPGPTAAGELVLRVARETVLLHAECRAALTGGYAEVPVPVAVNADSLATWFTEVLGTVADEPDLIVHLKVEDEARTTDLLRAGEVMAAVTTDDQVVQGCTTQPLGSLRYVPVAAPDLLRRMGEAGRGPEALGRLPMLQFDGIDGIETRLLQQVGIAEPVRSHLVPTADAFLHGIELGLGWGTIPTVHAEPLLESGDLVRLAPGVPVGVELYWQRWRVPSRTLDRLTEIVGQAAAVALDSHE